MGTSDCGLKHSNEFKCIQDLFPDSNIFCLDKLTPALFRDLLLHLNIAADHDMDIEKLKEVLSFSSIYIGLFKPYKLSDVVVVFNDSQVVNIVSMDKKVALYQLECEYPCVVCHFNVDDEGIEGQGLECSLCESWFHNNCTDSPLSDDLYNNLTESPNFIKICCPPCLKNSQVNKLHDKMNIMQREFKDELKSINQTIVDHVLGNQNIDNTSYNMSQDNALKQLGDTLQKSMQLELDSVKAILQDNLMQISEKIVDQGSKFSVVGNDITSLKSELITLNSNVDSNLLDCNSTMANSLQQKCESIIVNVEEVVTNLRDTSGSTSAKIQCLIDEVNGNAASFEAALGCVVDTAEKMSKTDIDFHLLSDTITESTKKMQKAFNDSVLFPDTIDSLTSKLVAELPTKLIPEIIATLPNCSHQNKDPPGQSSSQANAWITKGVPKINPGSITMSSKSRSTVNSNSDSFMSPPSKENSVKEAYHRAGNEMDVKKTISIGNVFDSSLSTSSKIKSEFNKCFPMMEIIHCKRAINGFILIELDTVENAQRVVKEWDGKRYFNQGQSKDTFAQILENARAKAIIEHVDEAFSDTFLAQEVQKTFGPKVTARRFRNKSGPTHVVMLSFESKGELEKAMDTKIPIGNVIFRARSYEQRARTIQCYNCNRFNHIARNCTASSRTCAYCCQSHHENDCNIKNQNEENLFKCSNCSGNHSALSKECEVYKRWSNKLRINHE